MRKEEIDERIDEDLAVCALGEKCLLCPGDDGFEGIECGGQGGVEQKLFCAEVVKNVGL